MSYKATAAKSRSLPLLLTSLLPYDFSQGAWFPLFDEKVSLIMKCIIVFKYHQFKIYDINVIIMLALLSPDILASFHFNHHIICCLIGPWCNIIS